MISSTIFCPDGHLMLAAQVCPICGWTRPPTAELGKPLWGPLKLGFDFGGPGRDVFAVGAIAQGKLVLPTRIGVLLGIRLADGAIQWENALPAGRMTRHVVAWGETILMSISDERALEAAGASNLVQMDPQTGEITSLWECSAHYLTPPVMADGRLLLRTSGEEVVCFPVPQDTGGEWRVLWRSPTVAWWALPLTVSDGVVVYADGRMMEAQHWLQAIRLEDGAPLWQLPIGEMLARPPVSSSGALVLADGRKKLLALDPQRGKVLWMKEVSRLYSTLATDGERVYLAIRSDVPSGESGHYQLLAIEARSGKLAWNTPLPARSRYVSYHEGALYLCRDDGCLACYDPRGGEWLWEYPLGGEEDPVQTAPLVHSGILVAGSYGGSLVALQSRPPLVEEPQTYLEKGDFMAAAEGFALGGDYRKAAEIFYRQLSLPNAALRLYEAAEDWEAAGKVAEERGNFSEALKYYESGGDLPAQARVLINLGRTSDAAMRYEQAGDLVNAGRYYEQSGLLVEAYRCAYRRGDQETLQRLRVVVPPTKEEIEDALKRKELDKAAELAMQNPQTLLLAADLYQKLGNREKELEALKSLVQMQHPPTSELLKRLANLARRCGRFLEEGQTWELLEEHGQAALAYERAAQQVYITNPQQEAEIANLYEKARRLYQESGQKEEAEEAWRKVVRFRQLPLVIVQGQAAESFREGEFNELELEVRNDGYSVAHEVVILPGSDRFEIACHPDELKIARLAPQRPFHLQLNLRPLSGQVGKVPLHIGWCWRDRWGNTYQEEIRTNVIVKSRSETPTAGGPVHIIYQGPVYSATAGGLIQMPGGDLVQDGSQKGDRVEIHRGSTSEKLEISAAPQAQFCPNCKLPVAAEDLFCQACGESLKPTQRKTERRHPENE